MTATARCLPATVRSEQLLDAAERVLEEKGLRATTVADIATAAGVAKGTVYLYFASKDALFAALRARQMRRVITAINVERIRTAVPLARLLAIARAMFDAACERPALYLTLFHEAGVSEPDRFRFLRQHVVGALHAAVQDDEVDATDVDAAASWLVAGVSDLVIDALREHADRPTFERMVAPLLVRTLGIVR
jgi:AcrR family transcriptional regulator